MLPSWLPIQHWLTCCFHDQCQTAHQNHHFRCTPRRLLLCHWHIKFLTRHQHALPSIHPRPPIQYYPINMGIIQHRHRPWWIFVLLNAQRYVRTQGRGCPRFQQIFQIPFTPWLWTHATHNQTLDAQDPQNHLLPLRRKLWSEILLQVGCKTILSTPYRNITISQSTGKATYTVAYH